MLKLISISILFIISISMITVAQAEIDVTTDSKIYLKGEEVKMFGFIHYPQTKDTTPNYIFKEPSGYDVIVRVYEPQFGNLVDIRQITPTDETFSTTFKSESPLWKHEGAYQILVNHAGDESTSEFLLVVG